MSVGNEQLVRTCAAVIGVVLVLMGALGFVNNPLVGPPVNNPLFVTGTIHDMIHLATGALALYIAFGLRGVPQANALIAFGALYLAIVVLTLISPDLFGILNYDVNGLDQVLHTAVGVVSIVVGVLGRGRTLPTGWRSRASGA
jgi:hypothetical protein